MPDKKIESLVADIYEVVGKGVDITPFHHEAHGENDRDGLRLSSIGQPCARKLWYEQNEPEKAEELEPKTKIMFMFGHVIEHCILDLARSAGHTVEHEQMEVELNGVLGHIDGVVGGVLVDVKSASPYSYGRFKDGLEADADKFGYINQLRSYLVSSRDRVQCDRNRAAFLAVNKVTGELHLDVHTFTEEELARVPVLVDERRAVVEGPKPERGFEDEVQGKSGNRKLCTNCSYCPFKQDCWPGLRTFLYSNKPEFLTVVEREPKVLEVFPRQARHPEIP